MKKPGSLMSCMSWSPKDPEQYRGVTYLAQIIEPLLQMRRYTEGELMAALVELSAALSQPTPAPMKCHSNEVNGSEMRPSDPDDYEMGPEQLT